MYIKKSISILPTKTCKLPLMIISPLIVMADLMSGVIRAMYYGNKTMEDIILLSSAAVVLFVAILFTANSVRALHFMWKKSQSTNQQHKLAVRRVSDLRMALNIADDQFCVYKLLWNLCYCGFPAVYQCRLP